MKDKALKSRWKRFECYICIFHFIERWYDDPRRSSSQARVLQC